MRKISLKNYDTDINNSKLPYDVRGSIKNIMLAGHNKHTPITLFDSTEIARKIMGAKKDEVLLEEREYQVVLKAINSYVGYREPDEKMLRAVIDAKEIDVKEK